jgi:uncharacterized protein (DUF433 family)
MSDVTAYIEKHNGGYWIAGTRVSLDSVVYAFLRGASPESIAQSFPALTLEQVYGGITFYLGHRAEVDDYLAQSEADFKELREKSREANPLLYQKLEAAKQKTPAR